MSNKNKIVVPSSDVDLEELQAIERDKERTPERPEKLKADRIYVADQVFQFRQLDENRLASENHIRELVRVLQAQEKPLDPILVTPVGDRFFVIDGHHRLGAYWAVDWDEAVPVAVFEGSLQEAQEEALKLNIKNKLPMTKEDKYEAAWRLVQLGPKAYSKARIRELTTVSERTIATMRKVLKEHGKAVEGYPWSQTRRKQWETQEEADADWRQQKAERLAEHLRTSGLGAELLKYPDIFADAVEMIDPELPEKLCWQWIDVVKEIVAGVESLDI